MSTNLADRDYHLRYEPEDYTVSPLGNPSRHLQSYDKYRLEEKQKSHSVAIPVVHYPSTLQEQSHRQTSGLHTSTYSRPLVQFAPPTPSSLITEEYLLPREEVRHYPNIVATSIPPYYHSDSSSSSSSSNSRQHFGKFLLY